MKNIFILIQLLLLILSYGCSTSPVVSTPTNGHLNGVEIKTDSGPIINQDVKDENIIESDVGNDSHEDSVNANKPEPSEGLEIIIGAGGYHCFGLVGFFKSLEKKHIKITQISGIEMGGILAALYAKYGKSSVVEWEIYKFINKLSEEDSPYTNKWNHSMKEFIAKNFNNINFSDLKYHLKLPAITKQGEVEWIDSGNVSDALNATLQISPSSYKKLKYEEGSEVNNKIYLDVLSSNLNFKNNKTIMLYKNLVISTKEIMNQGHENIKFKFPRGYVDSYKNWQNNGPIAQMVGLQFIKSYMNKKQKSE